MRVSTGYIHNTIEEERPAIEGKQVEEPIRNGYRFVKFFKHNGLVEGYEKIVPAG